MLPDSGGVAVTDKQGRFRFGGVLAGEHRCVARGARGEEVEVSLTVPGAAALTLAVPSASR
jgi:hypothetical protein